MRQPTPNSPCVPFRISLCSKRGRRTSLQDTALALSIGTSAPVPEWIPILLVLDGVGGNDGGDVAARRALRHLAITVSMWIVACLADDELSAPGRDDVLQALRHAVQSANGHVLDVAADTPGLKGMATTVVCGVVIAGVLYVAWLGDSRCYVFRGGSVRCLTKDHTLTGELIRAGALERKHANDHPSAHTVTRYLGDAKDVNVDAGAFALQPHDIVLMCTDGLTDVLSDAAIGESLRELRERPATFRTLAKRLVVQALRCGTQDNATALCLEHDPYSTDKRPCNASRNTQVSPLHLVKALRMVKENGNVRDARISRITR